MFISQNFIFLRSSFYSISLLTYFPTIKLGNFVCIQSFLGFIFCYFHPLCMKEYLEIDEAVKWKSNFDHFFFLKVLILNLKVTRLIFCCSFSVNLKFHYFHIVFYSLPIHSVESYCIYLLNFLRLEANIF